MNYRRTGYAAILIIAAMLFCSCASMSSANRSEEISKQKAIEIGTNEALKRGYNLDELELRVLENITPWQKDLPYLTWDEPMYKEMDALLNGRKYWGINYLPRKLMHGGSICVFVDASSGDIITVYEGH
jgi:hypothetical protein